MTLARPLKFTLRIDMRRRMYTIHHLKGSGLYPLFPPRVYDLDQRFLKGPQVLADSGTLPAFRAGERQLCRAKCLESPHAIGLAAETTAGKESCASHQAVIPVASLGARHRVSELLHLDRADSEDRHSRQ